MCTFGVSPLTDYLKQRDSVNWWNYPPPSLSPPSLSMPAIVKRSDNKAVHHVGLSSTVRTTVPNYQPFDDYLGLSGMLNNLTVSDPIPMAAQYRARLGSDGAELLDDFRANGVDTELDELDRIKIKARPRTPPPSTPVNLSPPLSVSPVSSASPPTTTTIITANEMRVLDLLRKEETRIKEELRIQEERRAVALAQQQVLASVLPPPPPPPPMSILTAMANRSGGGSSRARGRHGSGGSGGSGSSPGTVVCVFCRNNGEPIHVYTGHYLKDSTGRVTCPILRAYKCPYCRASGDNAHTKTYCPLAISALGEASLSADRVLLGKQSSRTSCGKKRASTGPTGGHQTMMRSLTGGTEYRGAPSYLSISPPSSVSAAAAALGLLHAFD